MKIKNIKIENLYGVKNNNFYIELNINNSINILYGCKGVGKTSIAELINAVILCDIKTIYNKFMIKGLSLTFEDNTEVNVINYEKDLDNKDLHSILKEELSNSCSVLSFFPIIYILKDNNQNEPYLFELDESEKTDNETRKFISGKLSVSSSNKLKLLQEKLFNKIKVNFIFATKPFEVENDFTISNSYSNTKNKIDLLLSIINNEFGLYNHKLIYNKTNCKLEIVNLSNNNISDSVSNLSFGEKRLIFLFKDLIFKCHDGDSIIIDDPGLSFEKKLQQIMIKSFMRIAALYNLQIIILTQSHDVINEYKEFTNVLLSERVKVN